MRSEDIAKLAGVSRSTVSRVINNYPNVPEATRAKVLRIIEQHQYEPNSFARALAGKRTDTIGLFAISMSEQENASRIYQNSYFAPIVDMVVDTANARGFYVLIHTVYSRGEFQKVKQAFQQKRIDGGILVGTQKDIELVREMVDQKAPLVLVDYDISEIMAERLNKNHLAVINSMDYEGTAEAIEYLIGLGHREIGIIKGSMNTYSGRERYLAYESTLQKHGLPLRDDFVLEGEFLKESAYREAKRLALQEKLPTALFCSNDDMAIAAMEAFAEHGIAVPDQLSIIGFDDALLASRITPKLTSVRLPVDEMAKAAVLKVIELCKADEATFSTVSFPTKLVVRDTCKPPVR
ncbi:LacI family DNA-binding transcriptional regulator [Paenibacillus macerans]|uniref:LacI family DNA-binding transcriptional regulator n=1 Tax=Paenibacillus macerans TaxID=44252 RepID=A0A6N8EZU2_PAEMA|nr:LacI family DNA-binding transcriptional regulator [Paenibacillus macerans]MUG23862.1 LacI family DNA-binding transcriptional regulator [Paenibacillus macerans]UMV46513.1 LacI family transcriptional regulator [Paenibacillus macerans]